VEKADTIRPCRWKIFSHSHRLFQLVSKPIDGACVGKVGGVGERCDLGGEGMGDYERFLD
jgi:hypothetical protein